MSLLLRTELETADDSFGWGKKDFQLKQPAGEITK